MLEILRYSFLVAERHGRIYCRNFISNASPTITDPLFFILAFGLGLGSYVSDIEGMSYAEYIGPGLAMTAVMYTAIFETTYNFYVRLDFDHIYDAMMTTPIGAREVVIGEFIWIAMKGASVSTAISVVFGLIGYIDPSLLLIMPFLGALLAVAIGGIGLIATSLMKSIDQLQMIFSFLIQPLFFFSGVFYPVDTLPKFLVALTHISPLFHAVQVAQKLFSVNPGEINLLYHLGALILFAIVLSYIGYRRMYPKLYS